MTRAHSSCPLYQLISTAQLPLSRARVPSEQSRSYNKKQGTQGHQETFARRDCKGSSQAVVHFELSS